MNTPIKIAIALGTVGGTVGGGVILHQQLTAPAKDIRNKLMSEGYEILDDKSEHWTNIFKSYADTVGEVKNSDLKFGDFDGKQAPNNTSEKLKEQCKTVLDSKDVNESNLKKARKWCTKPKTFTEILGQQGYRVLSVKDNDDATDKAEWNKKITEHNKKTENENKRFKDLDGSSSQTLTEDNEESRKKIKGKCKEILVKYHYEKDYEEILAKSKLWCAIENKKNNP